MKTYSIKRNYSSYQTGVFIYKSNSRIKHDLHCIISSLINPALLNFYFTLHYYLLFSWRNLFFWMFIFQWIQYSNVFTYFLVEKGAINEVRTQLLGMGLIQNTYNYVQRGRGCHALCVITRTISFHVFDSIFAL